MSFGNDHLYWKQWFLSYCTSNEKAWDRQKVNIWLSMVGGFDYYVIFFHGVCIFSLLSVEFFRGLLLNQQSPRGYTT